LAGRTAAPDKTWVALYDAGGTGGQGEFAVERILGRAGMRVMHVGAEVIAASSLANFDVAIFPGGSGSKQAAAIGERGRDQVRQFVERGGGYIGICAGAYHNGPVITQANLDAVPDYEVLAYFRTETAKNHTPTGVMVDSPAIAAGSYGQGRVLFVSPHPEQTPGLEDLVQRGAQWAAGRP
jgi:glutamine amidotransferase-like uncharacterized protein